MTTLYIRDVPVDVAETLKERAAAEGASLSAYVARELTGIARRPSHEAVAARLRERSRPNGVDTAAILDVLDAGRR
ncbi:FitA-like ribbon-helix-helix domain-containing protein [Brachybacterium huguangmaarense]